MNKKNHTFKSTVNALRVVRNTLENLHGNEFLTNDELDVIHKLYDEMILIALRVGKLNRTTPTKRFKDKIERQRFMRQHGMVDPLPE